ncbi:MULTISPECIES: glycoside hydrolase family 15 protein [unclassified Coleofasciculus]|uniref:glycoside hydrolase family 15 protein n=1 Tax=unclassified Coleofasciculus TaxID=2692782 RepID=UPI00187F89DC|nr:MULTISPECIES: glycoside hydrolase family 15 protein [unclassified Coleofasciculus]MBE9127543.1 glycoside hydrolase family 15 protein [Coleofasciculus sp. LEGE 07081]MBE9150872.1 glycoside hydrolase family 15 protein [Coleofasciculus sp. LEGE 07092]
MSIIAAQLPVRLNDYYQQVRIILNRQNPITGLLPASTAVNAHGDYTDAWVRDNVYSILAVWGLGLAYRKLDPDSGRTFELEQSVVKLMRGLLFCMMRQAHKVERFKETQSLLDALHAKYNTSTGDVVVGDDEWGHLQLDATSLYLLMLAQMTASGLHIVYTIDEVHFIQNLVYYIGRAYRTPDYGIWERGNKVNHGNPELNASSVGMAKAALEAINGLDLFGVRGSQASVIHVLPDEIARSRITLESLLPRESSSKETDAALLSVIGFPAFAIEDIDLTERTRKKIINKLQGLYGCKRFLRDGHQTVLEDTTRLHYEPLELQQFEHIECEWPLFFTYLALDGQFRGDIEQARNYLGRLDTLLVERDGIRLLPELYYVSAEGIDAERASPRSQRRKPNENVPLVWAQSLYLLGKMLHEGLIAPGDIDPLGRYLSVGRHQDPVVQIALLAEDEDLQAQLAAYGIASQTPQQVEPIQVRQATELSAIYAQIGYCDPLGLTGRPIRRLRSLTTSRIFRFGSETIVFLPALLDNQQFYLTVDNQFLIAQIKSELPYIQRHWSDLGRPTLTLLLTHTMLESDTEDSVVNDDGETLPVMSLLELLRELQEGFCNGVRVKLGRLNQLMLTAGTERIDVLHDFEFTQSPVKDAAPRCYYLTSHPGKHGPLNHTQEFLLECETNLRLLLDSLRQSENLYEQIELLSTLKRLRGLNFDTGFGGSAVSVTVADLLNEVYLKAGIESASPHWTIVRQAAGLLNKVDINLSDAVTDILVRGKQITVGKAYSEASLIKKPISHLEIQAKINEFCGEDIRDRVLSQEILVYLSLLIKSEPQLVDGLLTLRVGYLILLLTSELAAERRVTQDEAYEELMRSSPFEVKMRLRSCLAGYEGVNQKLRQQESLHVKQPERDINWIVLSRTQEEIEEAQAAGSWLRKRQLDGAASRIPKDFYPKVWLVLKHCKGLVIGDKLERRNRLDSEVLLSEMTPGEKNFALRVEHLLNKIQAPEYRSVNIETLMELAVIVEGNPELEIEEYIVLDVLIGHAVRLAWLERFPERAARYDEYKAAAWRAFYDTSPTECAAYIVKAFQFLTQVGQASVVQVI